MSTRVEQVRVPDGTFGLTVWTPETGRGPGILLIQEIYGVSDYIKAVAADLAELGYVVGAPDMFWRIRPGYAAAHDEAGLKESMAVASRYDSVAGLDDAEAAYRHLAALPEASGGAAIVGFCFGGTVAYELAARVDADAVVSFYGSEVPGHTDLLEQITSPILFHFGGSDPYIPRPDVARVEAAVRDHAGADIHVEEEAGHAFHNRKAPMFYQPEPAARAWRLTEEFLARHLPAAGGA
jgi:carboxymethylenebutenolidase